jgi:transcriptional regulator with GAF, ATPase, and Fis domain
LNLNEVSEAMKEGAKAAISKDLTYQEATRAFQLTLVNEALAQNDGVQFRAAMRLRIAPSWIAALVSGKAAKRTSFGRGRKKEKHQAEQGEKTA